MSTTNKQQFLTAEDRFNKAVNIVNKTKKDSVSEDEKGKIYALYKQATEGDCKDKCPNMITDYVGYRKWNYWMKQKGKDKMTAMNEYADFVIDMVEKYNLLNSNKK